MERIRYRYEMIFKIYFKIKNYKKIRGGRKCMLRINIKEGVCICNIFIVIIYKLV